MTSQAGPTPLPPTTILSSKRIPQSAAHDFLAAYLDRATTDPGLQPDSTLSTHGPVSANTGSSPNLVIHNLKRVQAGLAGEVLGRDLIFAKLAAGATTTGGIEEGNNMQAQNATTGGAAGASVTGEWQDAQSFEREQQIDATTGEKTDDEGIGRDIGEKMDVDEEGMPVEHKISKEERKKKKKERRKAEQRAKASSG